LRDEGRRGALSPIQIVALVVRHVRPALGWRTPWFVGTWALRLPQYRKRFVGAGDALGLREIKQSLFPLAALHHELVGVLGEPEALAVSRALTLDVATHLQRRWYLTSRTQRSWAAFHLGHERQMRSGLLRHNEHTLPTVTPVRVEFRITRCLLHEAMAAMDAAPLTEAFCRSDEIVFNEYLPEMRFHRDDAPVNTIARGARDCGFAFERKGSAA